MLTLLVKALSILGKGIIAKARKVANNKELRADLVVEKELVINSARDARVCKFCREMDGRKIKMPLLASQNFMFEYGQINEKSGYGRQNLLPAYHPNCRCDVMVR